MVVELKNQEEYRKICNHLIVKLVEGWVRKLF